MWVRKAVTQKKILKAKKPERDAYACAIDLLSRREHSQLELWAKLEKREFPQEQIEKALEQLITRDYQSDQRFLEDFVRSRVLRGKGPLLISQELRQRGVDRSAFEAHCHECEIDWYEVAEQTYLKKFGEIAADSMRERAKRVRFMQSKGFPGDIIGRICRK